MPVRKFNQDPPPPKSSTAEDRNPSSMQLGARPRVSSVGSSSNPSSPYESPVPSGRAPPSKSTMPSVFSLTPSSSDRTPSPTKKAEGEEDMDIEERGDEESGSDDEVPTVRKPLVHIEARMRATTTQMPRLLRANLDVWLEGEDRYLEKGPLSGWQDINCLCPHLDSVIITDISGDQKEVRRSEVDIRLYVYRMSDEVDEELAGGTSDDEEDEQSPAAASSTSLPCTELDGLWDNLIYPGAIKKDLLQYVSSSAYLSALQVDPSVVNWNRLVLLHGPPGTGKTSLCKALAQKVAIRLSAKYEHTKLVEVHSHSLFSKYFSESGKLVGKLFSQINEMVHSASTFVVVMIDEVESLTSARATQSSDPGDALRVVNALLTQLDKLKRHPNVLVLTTSNLSQTIDPAFLDRADFKTYIPLPAPEAVYWMLRTCFLELMHKGAMKTLKVHQWPLAKREYEKLSRPNGIARPNGHSTSTAEANGAGKKPTREERAIRLTGELAKLAYRCHKYEISGRTLKRLPLKAHTKYLGQEGECDFEDPKAISPERWIDALAKVIEEEQADRMNIGINTPESRD